MMLQVLLVMDDAEVRKLVKCGRWVLDLVAVISGVTDIKQLVQKFQVSKFWQDKKDFVIIIVMVVDLNFATNDQFNGLVQERGNSSALAMELRLSCTDPSSYLLTLTDQWSTILNLGRLWRNKEVLPLSEG